MGGRNDGPRAYSTQLGGDYQGGYHADGYSVVIKPDQLTAAVNKFRSGLQDKSPADLNATLLSALVDEGAFGQLPNAQSAFGQVREFVQSHAHAMSEMGVSLADFVARVQAAADLGYQADPVTKAEAAMRHGHMMME